METEKDANAERELLRQSKKFLHKMINGLEKLQDGERERVMRTLIVWYKHDKRRTMREAADS